MGGLCCGESPIGKDEMVTIEQGIEKRRNETKKRAVTKRDLSVEELKSALTDILFGPFNETIVCSVKSNDDEMWGVLMHFSEDPLAWKVKKLMPQKQFHNLGIRVGYRLHRFNEMIVSDANKEKVKTDLVAAPACEVEFETNTPVKGSNTIYAENWSWMQEYMRNCIKEAEEAKSNAVNEHKQILSNLNIIQSSDGRKRVFIFLANAHTYQVKVDEKIVKAIFDFYSNGEAGLDVQKVRKFMNECHAALVDLASTSMKNGKLTALLRDSNPLAIRRAPNVAKRIRENKEKLKRLNELAMDYPMKSATAIQGNFANYNAFRKFLPEKVFPEETGQAEELQVKLERFEQLLLMSTPPKQWTNGFD